MRLYKILENGYQVGQAKGKNSAVKHIKTLVEYDGTAHLSRWMTINGDLTCNVGDKTYVISKDTTST